MGNLRTLERVGSEWVTDDVLGGPFLEPLDEFVVDTLLHVHTGTSTAALAVVEEDSEVDPGDGVVNVGVVEDNVGALAAEFEGDLLQVGASGGLHDLTTDDSGTGEGNLVDIHVGRNGSTGNLSETGDDVDNTRGETGVLDQLSGVQTGEGGLLGGLQDHSVTAGNSRSDLPCPHKDGEVPGNDLTANTDL